LLALAVREPAERERVGRVEEPYAVLERQPDAAVEFVRDVAEPCTLNSVPHVFQCYYGGIFDGRQTPGGHAKWGRSPRGAATVSGERPPRTTVLPKRRAAARRRMGRGNDATIREPGYLAGRAQQGRSEDLRYFRGARARRKEARSGSVRFRTYSLSFSLP